MVGIYHTLSEPCFGLKIFAKFWRSRKNCCLLHDIERAFRDETKSPEDYLNFEFLRNHQEGAEIMRKFLTKNNASNELIETVLHLIFVMKKVEIWLKCSHGCWFCPVFWDKCRKFCKKESSHRMIWKKSETKIEWMYHRISSDMAHEEAKKTMNTGWMNWKRK